MWNIEGGSAGMFVEDTKPEAPLQMCELDAHGCARYWQLYGAHGISSWAVHRIVSCMAHGTGSSTWFCVKGC